MYGFNYERLTTITEKEKPFRGTSNRFPFERRSRNEKYFLVEEENGEKVYDIVYGKKYRSEEITKEQYDELKAIDSNRVYEWEKYDFDNHRSTGVFVYHRRHCDHNIVARVRPDNTFELIQDEYHQGERNFLSQSSRGLFVNNSRRGGLIYKDKSTMHAIHEGMRIACDSGMSVVPYEVELKKVNRKKAKDTIKPYEDFFKVSEVMCKSMSYEQFKDTTIEICKERFSQDKEIYDIDKQKLIKEAYASMFTEPLDALILYALGYDVNNFAWSFRWGRTFNDNGEKTYQLYMNAKRRILKELYISHKEIFMPYRIEGGKYFPTSEWGTEVIVNNVLVKQL